ncbi:class I adenylate-forming enzyme family protein [Pseudogemmobacter sonorensis]|uniref:class I adenylate-forming enzyme family protein n=1 Tax=Pseudogemmobacter sonorensis TaxID=2989681 RepID=UPI00367A45C6
MPPFLTLHHPRSAAAYYRTGLWQDDTFYTLLRRNADLAPQRLALVDGGTGMDWRTLLARVDGLAADLGTYGLRTGDRVCGWMPNRAEMVIAMLACSREGYAFNPSLHRSHTAAEVGQLLNGLSARALLMEEGWGADAETANLTAILAGVASLKAVYTPESFPAPGPNRSAWQSDPDAVAYLAHTSGSSGAPKCVMHSANTLLANARELARDWRLDPETVIYPVSPLSHHIAWVAFGQWLLTGCRYVLNNPPPGMSTLDWIIASGATYVLGVPTHALDLIAEEARRGCGFGRIRQFYLAGAPIPAELCEDFRARGIIPQNVYGMTENSSHHYTLPGDGPRIVSTTCGRGGQAYEVRIFDESDPDRALPPGQVGQIGGRGAALMLGYFANQRATETSFNREGWFMSGDLGMLDAEGNLKVVGRLKDAIIRGGHNIYPAHIEQAALTHPGVRQAACVPVPDRRLGERVCLALSGGASPDEVLAVLRGRGLSKYDMPEYMLNLPALPVLPSGKIHKRELSERIRRRELEPVMVTPQRRGEAPRGMARMTKP